MSFINQIQTAISNIADGITRIQEEIQIVEREYTPVVLSDGTEVHPADVHLYNMRPAGWISPEEQATADARVWAWAQDPIMQEQMEDLINPATGLPYTDQEIQDAIARTQINIVNDMGFPLQTWSLNYDGETDLPIRASSLRDILSANIQAEFQIIQLDDATYQFIVKGGLGSGIDIPLPLIEAGIYGAVGITFDISVHDLAALGQHIPLPDDIYLDNADSNLGNLNWLDNISSLSIESNLSGALAGLDIPIPAMDVLNRLTNFQIPENINLTGEVTRGYEIRQTPNGTWEVVSKAGYSHSYDYQYDGVSPGGWKGAALDTLTIADLDTIEGHGTITEVLYEQVYDVETGEFSTRRIETRTEFSGEGVQGGFDWPLLDEISDTANKSILEKMYGTFDTVITEVVTDSEGNVVQVIERQSQGTFDNGKTDFFIANSEINATYEGHHRPTVVNPLEMETTSSPTTPVQSLSPSAPPAATTPNHEPEGPPDSLTVLSEMNN